MLFQLKYFLQILNIRTILTNKAMQGVPQLFVKPKWGDIIDSNCPEKT